MNHLDIVKSSLIPTLVSVLGMGILIKTTSKVQQIASRESTITPEKIEELVKILEKNVGTKNIPVFRGNFQNSCIMFSDENTTKESLEHDLGFQLTLVRGKLTKDSPIIILGEGGMSDVHVLAHEIGHGIHSRKKSNDLMKKMHRYRLRLSKLPHWILPVTMVIGALQSGTIQGLNDLNNKKTSAALKHGWKIAHMIDETPVLISEYGASKKALEILKEIGVSPEDYKRYKKELISMYGTYLGTAIVKYSLSLHISNHVRTYISKGQIF